MNKKLRAEIAAMRAPLPSVTDTMRAIETRAIPETRARIRRLIKDQNALIRDLLQDLDAWSAHENLVSKQTVEHVHRMIRRRLRIEEPPSGSPSATASEPT